jgi:ribosomal protein S18 acetylase RimI-like enzyme
MNPFIIKQAETIEELQQILKLQSENHVHNLGPIDKKSNGFVTVKHDLDLLKKMNSAIPQVIAKQNEEVVGYALVMLKEFKEMIPVLIPMFEMFGTLSYKNKFVNEYDFYVMGQICISKTCRGQGIFENMYLKHKELYSNRFQICVTEVSVNNIGSMKAHERVGFKTIHTFRDQTDEWNIMLWDWR